MKLKRVLIKLTDGRRAELRRARKDHTCSECGQLIPRGTMYYCIYYGKGLGSLKFPDRAHEHCVEVENDGENTKEVNMDLVEQILHYLELSTLVTLANNFYHITTEEAGLHQLEIARDIAALKQTG